MRLVAILSFLVVLSASVVQADHRSEPPPISVAEAESTEADLGGALLIGHISEGALEGYWNFQLTSGSFRPLVQQFAKRVNAGHTANPEEADLIAEFCIVGFDPGETFGGAALGSLAQEIGMDFSNNRWVVRTNVSIHEASRDQYGNPCPGRLVAGPFLGVGKANEMSWRAFLDQYRWFRSGVNFYIGQHDSYARSQYAALAESVKKLKLQE